MLSARTPTELPEDIICPLCKHGAVDFEPIEGSQPLASELPKGCLFYDRCEKRTADCENIKPEMKEIRNGKVRCIHAT